eukprot:3350030-Amphidinium_carterae.2
MPLQEIERIVSEGSGRTMIVLSFLEVWVFLLPCLSTGPILGSLHALAVLLSHNLLQGSIPQHVFDGWDPMEKWVAARTSVSVQVLINRRTELSVNCSFKSQTPSMWCVLCLLAWLGEDGRGMRKRLSGATVPNFPPRTRQHCHAKP